MQYSKYKDDYFIYIEKNEKAMLTITQFCESKNIQNGRISGIGAVRNTEIGAYDIVKKKYLKKESIGGIGPMSSFLMIRHNHSLETSKTGYTGPGSNSFASSSEISEDTASS